MLTSRTPFIGSSLILSSTTTLSLPTEIVSLIIKTLADLASSDLQYLSALRTCLQVSQTFYALSSRYIFLEAFSIVTFRRRRKLVDGERLRLFYAILTGNPTLQQYVKELRIGHDCGQNTVSNGVDMVSLVLKALPLLESLTFSADMAMWSSFSQPLKTSLLDTFESERLTNLRLHSIVDVPPEVFNYFRNLSQLEVRYVTLTGEQSSQTTLLRPHPPPKLKYLCFSFSTDVSLLIAQHATIPSPKLNLEQLEILNAQIADIDAARATAMIFQASSHSLHTVSLDLGQETIAALDLSQLHGLKTIEFDCSIQQYRDDFMEDVVLLLNSITLQNKLSRIHFTVLYKDDYPNLYALDGIEDGWWSELDDALARPTFHSLKNVEFSMKQRTRGIPDPKCNNEWVDMLWGMVKRNMPLLFSSPTITATTRSLEILYT